jgi:hypothetical protein
MYDKGPNVRNCFIINFFNLFFRLPIVSFLGLFLFYALAILVSWGTVPLRCRSVSRGFSCNLTEFQTSGSSEKYIKTQFVHHRKQLRLRDKDHPVNIVWENT